MPAASRLFAVAIMAAAAIFICVALACGTYSAEQNINRYLKSQNAADFWITGAGFDRSDIRKIFQIEGVKNVQPWIIVDAESFEYTNISIALYALPNGERTINIPYIVEGREMRTARDIMISDEFASANGLSVGDFYEVKATATGNILKLHICALVKSPEFLYHVSGTNVTPDLAAYGFGYISEDAAASFMERNRYNQICITVNDEADLEKIKQKLTENLGAKAVNILALEDNASAGALLKRTGSIKAAVLFLPVICFVAAALIMYCAVRRLIEHTPQIVTGLNKLEFGRRKILCCYLMYAVLAVTLGCVLGALFVRELLGAVSSALYGNMDMPAQNILVSPCLFILCFAIIVIISIGAAYMAIKHALHKWMLKCDGSSEFNKAEQILLKRPFVKRNKRRLHKKDVLCLRNKPKRIIRIVSAAGCMALVLAALGLNDSINNFMDRANNKLQNYDLMVTLSGAVTEAQYQHLRYLPQVDDVQYEMTMGVKLYSQTRLEAANLKVTEDQLKLSLLDINGPEVYDMPFDGVVLSEETAEKLDVAPDDKINVKFGGDNRYYPMRVARVIRGAGDAYISQSYWNTFRKPFTPNTVYLKTENLDAVRGSIQDFDFVVGSQDKTTIGNSLKSQIRAAAALAYLPVLFGGVLLFVVFYHLEWIIELRQVRLPAAMKSLRLYSREKKRLTRTENEIASAAGILFGILLGRALAGTILKVINLDLSISILSYVVSGILTVVFTVLINKILDRKISKCLSTKHVTGEESEL